MTDSLFNLVIILIPVAIFIGRFVIAARNKRNPPPPPPRIPVHFEDDDDEDERNGDVSPYLSRGATEYFKGLSSAAPRPAPSRPPHSSGKLAEAIKPHGPGNLAASIAAAEKAVGSGSSAIGPKIPPSSGGAVSVAAPGSLPGQKSFSLNVDHLSPLKQAVVMAEVLGPPKGV